MINAESTMAKLEEFEIEKQRLTKIRENPKIRQANIRKQIYRKKVRRVFFQFPVFLFRINNKTKTDQSDRFLVTGWARYL